MCSEIPCSVLKHLGKVPFKYYIKSAKYITTLVWDSAVLKL